MLLEAENFQFQDGWAPSHLYDCGGEYVLYVKSGKPPVAFTVFNSKSEGEYIVWVSSRDYAKDNPKSRRFEVIVNDVALPRQAGRHGREGLYWEMLGTAHLDSKENKVGIRLVTNSARCDAIIFTKDKDFNPNEKIKSAKDRKPLTVEPTILEYIYEADYPKIETLKGDSKARAAQIGNANLQIFYLDRKDSAGKTRYVRAAEVFDGKAWTALPPYDDEALLLFTSPDPKLVYSKYYAAWNESKTGMFALVRGEKIYLQNCPNNPFLAGKLEALRPASVKKLDERTLLLKYDFGVEAKLSIDESKPFAKFEVSKTAESDAYYSFAFLGFNARDKNDFEHVQLPTVYQNTRIMSEPRLVPITMTSHPLALLQTKDSGISVSSALIADPAKLPFIWPRHETETYGFSLATPDNSKVQTSIFNPIIGGVESFKKSGEKLEAHFYIMTIAGNWREGLEISAESIFDVSRMREPIGTSLSDALCNIAEYLKREGPSGWSKEHKARWNIEGQNVATQAAALAEMSASILTQDEEAYRNIAIPTLEYVLTRNSFHYTPFLMPGHSYFGADATRLRVPGGSWNPDTFAGANWLLGGANKWIRDVYVFDSEKFKQQIPEWTMLLGLYLAEPDEELLKRVVDGAEKWIESMKAQRFLGEPNMRRFINVSLYPYWWYMPDLYEITKDPKHLDYAVEGAF